LALLDSKSAFFVPKLWQKEPKMTPFSPSNRPFFTPKWAKIDSKMKQNLGFRDPNF